MPYWMQADNLIALFPTQTDAVFALLDVSSIQISKYDLKALQNMNISLTILVN